MYIGKDFYFESAHKLDDYDGKCNMLHGHSYKLSVIIKGPIKADGMVMDYGDLKKIVNEKVINKLDHLYLNEIVKVPTAENLLKFIWNELTDVLPLYELRLWETRDSFAYYRGEDESN